MGLCNHQTAKGRRQLLSLTDELLWRESANKSQYNGKDLVKEEWVKKIYIHSKTILGLKGHSASKKPLLQNPKKILEYSFNCT